MTKRIGAMIGALIGAALLAAAWAEGPEVWTLAAGFEDDPRKREVVAGAAWLSADGCALPLRDPDLVVDYTPGELPLAFMAVGSGGGFDATLVVAAPDGEVFCDDDSFGQLDAGIKFNAPAPGRYRVFAGVLGEDATVELWVSERRSGLVSVDGPPVWTLTAGFEDDPRKREVVAGAAWLSADGCALPLRDPDLVVDYTPGELPLAFMAVGSGGGFDATLVVAAPDGEVFCDDDSFGQLDAGIKFNAPAPGRYRVFAGVLGEDATVELWVSERRSGLVSVDGPPVWTLTAGFEDDPRKREVVAGAAWLSADGCALPLRDPDLVVDYTPGEDYMPGELPLAFMAVGSGGGFDATLVVAAPDEEVFCDDDSFEDRDAQIVFQEPAPGRYRVFAGVFDEGVTVELWISEKIGGSGTGFVVAERHLVTAAHMVDDTDRVWVKASGLPAFQAQVVARNAAADIALLVAEDAPDGLAAATLRTEPVRLAERLFVFGFPLPILLPSSGVLTDGIVAGLAGFEDDASGFSMTAPLEEGHSGSPVFDESCRVLGVAVSAIDSDLISFAVTGAVMRALLDKHGVAYRTAAEPALCDIAETVTAVTVAIWTGKPDF